MIVVSATSNPRRFAELTGAAPVAGTETMRDERCTKINAAAFAAADKGQLPCYAAWIGKRGAVAWVSFGSSCKIGRGEATKWLKWCGVDIAAVEREGMK